MMCCKTKMSARRIWVCERKVKIEPNGCVRMDVPVRMYQNGNLVKIEG